MVGEKRDRENADGDGKAENDGAVSQHRFLPDDRIRVLRRTERGAADEQPRDLQVAGDAADGGDGEASG
jgi:hypothetical protein